MAIVVEDGTGIAGANSYGTPEDLFDYAELRGVAIPKEEAPRWLIAAMDFMATLEFAGDQIYGLPFPRANLILPNGVEVPPNVIPAAILNGQLQLALDAKRGVNLTPSRSAEQQVKREKVGPIETEFFGAADAAGTDALSLPVAMAYLNAFLASSQPFKFRTYRA